MNTFIKFFVALLISIFFYSTFPLIAMDEPDPLEEAHHLITQDPDGARQLFENTAEDPDRAFSVALYLENIKRPEEALQWYLQIGDPESLTKAAELLIVGVGGRPNRGKAIRCYEDAAKKGNSWAKKQIGVILAQWAEEDQNTRCKKKNRDTFQDTLVLFLVRNPALTSEINDPDTLLKTGKTLEAGVAVSQNLTGAFYCYARASQLKCGKAALKAAALLQRGLEGQDPDLERAGQFLSHARRLGFTEDLLASE